MPDWGEIYNISLQGLIKLDVPILNPGLSGKDAHKYTERLGLVYYLNVIPKLLKSAIMKLTDSNFD